MSFLEEYYQKRDFAKTPEPKGDKVRKKINQKIFVIQRHYARKEHYDLRLEHEGILKSWSIPKGPSLSSRDKRLAIPTEDHPLEYADFEGIIPPQQYGAGIVSIWDKGTYWCENFSGQFDKGHLTLILQGKILQCKFSLIKTGEQWLLVKHADAYEIKDFTFQYDGRTVTQSYKKFATVNIEKELFPFIKKRTYLDYYARIVPYMIKYIAGHPLTLYRFPNGVQKEGFFQKQKPDSFPSWLEYAPLQNNEIIKYILCYNEADILFVANQVAEFHISITPLNHYGYPDRIIFDIDPQEEGKSNLLFVTISLGKFLQKIGFVPYVMTTGSRGFHICVPIKQDTEQQKIIQLAQLIAKVFSRHFSNLTTIEQRKEKRDRRIFIDTYRNIARQTAAAPYTIRARANAPVAAPISWEELDKTSPQQITLFKMMERIKQHGDLWENFRNDERSVKDIQKKLQ